MPNPAEALLEGLITIAIDHFYVMMEHIVDLAINGSQSVAFLQPILSSCVENIRRVGGTERAQVYESWVVFFSAELEKLRLTEGSNIGNIAYLALPFARLKHTRLLEEIKKKEAAEQVIDKTQSSLQDSAVVYQTSEASVCAVTQLINTFREVILKA